MSLPDSCLFFGSDDSRLSRSQLQRRRRETTPEKWEVAERTGLEPATSAVTGQRSNQLNYRSTVWRACQGLRF